MNQHTPPEDYEAGAAEYQPGPGYVSYVQPVSHWLYVAAILNSALYLVGVFLAGVATGNKLAWSLALVTMGLCYFAPVLQIAWPRPTGAQSILLAAVVLWSLTIGTAAGWVLVFG